MRRRSLATCSLALGGALLALTAACGGTSHASTGPAPATTPATATQASTTPAVVVTPTPTPTTICVNAAVSAATRAALVRADGRPGATETPGTLFYGLCGTTAYAVSSFSPVPNATLDEQVSFQDDGALPEFFVENAGAWSMVGRAQGPPGPPTCATFTALPASLRTFWNDCLQTQQPMPTPSVTSCAQWAAAHVFVQAVSATVAADGSATVVAHPTTVHCGGPDDLQYLPATATENLHLLASAKVAVLAATGTGINDVPITIAKLPNYLATAHTGKFFQVSGTLNAVTGFSENYTP